MTTRTPLPPTYWLSILLDAIRDGDFSSAARAHRHLKEQGIDVSLRRMVPDCQQLKREDLTP